MIRELLRCRVDDDCRWRFDHPDGRDRHEADHRQWFAVRDRLVAQGIAGRSLRRPGRSAVATQVPA